MGNATELLSAITSAFERKDFDSRDSIVHLNQSGNYVFEWSNSEMKVKGELSQADSIGFLMNAVEFSKNIHENVDMSSYLKTVAEAIEKRINYLMEPLKIVEVDSTSNAVQIRSEKPELQDGALSYFEIVLKAGKWFGHRNHVALHRFTQKQTDEGNRSIVPFPVTKKQFEKLVNDFLEIL